MDWNAISAIGQLSGSVALFVTLPGRADTRAETSQRLTAEVAAFEG